MLKAFLERLLPTSKGPRKKTSHLSAADLAPYFPEGEFPTQPLWREVAPMLRERFSEPQVLEEAWWETTRHWLAWLAAQLGESYAVHESHDFMILAAGQPRHSKLLLESAEDLLRRTRSVLGEVGRDARILPFVILRFADPHAYYDYKGEFEELPEDEPLPASGASFFYQGYPHVATVGANASEMERIIISQISHALLHGLNMPAWLAQGVSGVLPSLVLSSCCPRQIDHKLVTAQQTCWKKHGLHGFWSGEAFRCPERSAHAAALSEVLVNGMLVRKLNLIGFMAHADPTDAGVAASKSHLGCELGVLAQEFLGDGISGIHPTVGPQA